MSAVAIPSVTSPALGGLDQILFEICEELQLPPHRHDQAESRYKAVAGVLEAEQSPFRSFRPVIYPQGSMPLGTTVKPVEGPHDLDFVLELSLSHVNVDPLRLLDQLFLYLKSHGTYSSMVSRKNRCVRITYADEFYMDILPGCKDLQTGGTCIQVPDRELECWKPSNPIGYLRWFGIQNKLGTGLRILEKAMPLPAQQSTEEKRPLQLAVQLLKRWRDLYYATPDLAPISIVLTTLAADVYNGEQSVSQTLSNILARITDRIVAAEAAGDRVRVHNPSNLEEDLSERWDGNHDAYNAFTSGMRAFNRQLQDLIRRTGDVNPQLQRLFGETVDTVLIKRAKQVQDERRRGGLGVSKSGLITSAAAGVLPVRANTFHGTE